MNQKAKPKFEALMESSTSFVTTKDGFEVTMNKTDAELIIEVEDQASGSVFCSKFSNDAIKSMSLELFENVPELFEGLATAFEGISDDTGVKVGQEGKLFFIQKVKIGKHEKIFNFPIPLKLVEVDPINRLEKQMRKLFREVEEVKKENQRLKERFNVVDYDVISPDFNATDTFYGNFEVSKDKKQITRNGNNSGSHMPLSSEAMLSQEKNSKFQVKIQDFAGTVAIGIATRDATRNQNCYAANGAYCITNPNYIYENGANIVYTNYSKLVAGSVVGVLFIPHRSEVLFDINGIYISTLKISGQHQKVDFYPFVSFSHNGSKLSFI